MPLPLTTALDFTMIFAASTDDRSLMSFGSEEEVVSYCESLDVEAGGWLFWDNAGTPIQAEFLVPNKRGLLLAKNGRYRLIAAAATCRAALTEMLFQFASFEGPPPFNSAEGVRNYLLQQFSAARSEQQASGARGEI